MLLLNPGPVTLSPRVRAALARPDLCHREPEFFALQDEVRKRLLAVHDLDPSTWTAVLLTGSATAGVEAMIATLVPRTGRVLVIENGVYGERLSEICDRNGIDSVRVTVEWGLRLPIDEVAQRLRDRPGITHVAVVHHETTTGRLNDLEVLSAICRARGVGLLVDAVSSFGAEAIPFDGIAACASTAHKCLHGAPGIAFVIARRAALDATDAARSLYLDLKAYARLQDKQSTPFTPAVHVLHALREALHEHADEGGRAARMSLYLRRATIVETGMARVCDIRPLLPAVESSVVLRAYRLPRKVSYEFLHDGLKARGFVIYAAQGALRRILFRIAVMGDLPDADLERLVLATSEVVRVAKA